MQQPVVTYYSNQLHQLLVTVSKHFYFGADGHAKYQEKPMDFNVTNCHKSKREHLVYYVLRDHFSGNFVFKIATSKRLIPLADFLHYAFSENVGEEKHLWGMPENIMVPKIIFTEALLSGLQALNITLLHPPSGFASGIRIIRDIEDHLGFYMGRTVDHTLEGMNNLRSKVYKYCIFPSHGDSKFTKWQEGLPAQGHPNIVPAYADFSKFFATVSGASPAGSSPLPAQSDIDCQLDERRPRIKRQNLETVRFSEEKLRRAQELIYEAWEEPDWQARLTMARKALSISPYCADAYILLAKECDSPLEKLNLFEKGVTAGRMALGDLFFKRYAGSFWGYVASRPFMRAMAGLSNYLWKTGERQKAVANYQEMLRLNPNDNQGVRYVLVNRLLALGKNEEAARLLDEYSEATSFMLYSETILAFRRQGPAEAAGHLREAYATNTHIPAYLRGLKLIPWSSPDHYSYGSEDEAVIYAENAREVWQETPGALAWLADQVASLDKL